MCWLFGRPSSFVCSCAWEGLNNYSSRSRGGLDNHPSRSRDCLTSYNSLVLYNSAFLNGVFCQPCGSVIFIEISSQDEARLASATEPKRMLIAALIIGWKVTHDEPWEPIEIEGLTFKQIVDAELVLLRLIKHNAYLPEGPFFIFKKIIIDKTIDNLFDLYNIIGWCPLENFTPLISVKVRTKTFLASWLRSYPDKDNC